MSVFTVGVAFECVLAVGVTVDVFEELRECCADMAVVTCEIVVIVLPKDITSGFQFVLFGISAERTSEIEQVIFLLCESIKS